MKNLGVAQLVARYLGVVEAARSSRVTQTRKRVIFGLPVFPYFARVSGLFDGSRRSQKRKRYTPQKRPFSANVQQNVQQISGVSTIFVYGLVLVSLAQ